MRFRMVNMCDQLCSKIIWLNTIQPAEGALLHEMEAYAWRVYDPALLAKGVVLCLWRPVLYIILEVMETQSWKGQSCDWHNRALWGFQNGELGNKTPKIRAETRSLTVSVLDGDHNFPWVSSQQQSHPTSLKKTSVGQRENQGEFTAGSSITCSIFLVIK